MTATLLRALAVACACAVPQDAPAGPERSVRDQFRELPAEERSAVQENFRRWQTLSDDERELMRHRHERLEIERERAADVMPDDDRARFDALRDHERHHELTRRAKQTLKERHDDLPPELRGRIDGLRRDLPPPERSRQLKKLVKQELKDDVIANLRKLVVAGRLERGEVDALAEQAQAIDDPRERLDLLRHFIVTHGAAFNLPGPLSDRIRDEPDPGFALHLLDRFRRSPDRGPDHGEVPPHLLRPRRPHPLLEGREVRDGPLFRRPRPPRPGDAPEPPPFPPGPARDGPPPRDAPPNGSPNGPPDGPRQGPPAPAEKRGGSAAA